MFVLVAIFVVILTLLLQGCWKSYVGTLQDKTIFITGCDTGFGRMMALEYCKQGAHVLAACLTEDASSTLSSEAKGSGTLTTLILDVTDTKSIQDAVAFVKAELEKENKSLYALINNAGIYLGWLVEMTDNEEFKKVMDVNFLGCVMVTKAFLPLIQQPGGRIVTIASAASLLADRGLSAYASSKFAISGFMDSLRRELRWTGIKVIKILPGTHKTPLVHTHTHMDTFKQRYQDASEDIKSRYIPSCLSNSIKTWQLAMKIAGDPLNVVHCVQDALLLKHPSAAYLIGYEAHLIAYPLSFLPLSWADCFLSLAQNLNVH